MMKVEVYDEVKEAVKEIAKSGSYAHRLLYSHGDQPDAVPADIVNAACARVFVLLLKKEIDDDDMLEQLSQCDIQGTAVFFTAYCRAADGFTDEMEKFVDKS